MSWKGNHTLLRRLLVCITLVVFMCFSALCRADGPAHSLFFPPPEFETAEPLPLSFDTSMSLLSSYMFRGQLFHEGLSLQPSAQAHLELGQHGMLNAILWMQLPLDNRDNSAHFIEMDQGLSYDYTYSRITASIGHYWYTFPDSSDDRQSRREVWGALALDTMLAPTLTVFHEYELYNMQYYDLNISHTFEKSGEGAFHVTLFSDFGFSSNGEKLYAKNGLVQITSGISTEICIGEVIINPTIAYSASEDENTVNKFWGGVTVLYSF